MKNGFIAIILITSLLLACKAQVSHSDPLTKEEKQNIKSIYEFTVEDIDGRPVNLSDYQGKVLVIVNTASKCGLTPQYAEIQEFYEQYKDKGVVVLGFPANDFLKQEPGSNDEIKGFCEANYGVTFPMFSKISVKGKEIAPLYKYLTEKKENGALDASVSWNFQKFLIDKDGYVVASFSPRTTVKDEEFLKMVNDLIAG